MKRRMKIVGVLLAMALMVPLLGAVAPAAEAGYGYPSQGQCVYHWVRPGQTLSGIASYYGVNMWTIAERNGIANPNRIYAGQRLLIYCKPKPVPPPPPPCRPPSCYPHPAPPPPPPCWPPSCVPQPVPPPPVPCCVPPPGPVCSIQPVLGFGRIWYGNPRVAAALGCPTAPEQGMSAQQVFFHGGYMLLDMNTRTWYVFYDNKTWTTMPGDGQPCPPMPVGYQHGYGPGCWCVPQFVQATIQPYQNGQMLWSSGRGIFVMYNNGTYQLFQ